MASLGNLTQLDAAQYAGPAASGGPGQPGRTHLKIKGDVSIYMLKLMGKLRRSRRAAALRVNFIKSYGRATFFEAGRGGGKLVKN